MKNKILLVLFSMVCIEIFIPKKVFAMDTYYNQFIDYRFSILDNSGNSVEGLKFKLYDQNNYFSYESEYDETDNVYYFKYDLDEDISSVFPSGLDNFFENYRDLNYNSCDQFTDYYKSLFSDTSFITKDWLGCYKEGRYFYLPNNTAYKLVPLILEELNSGNKKIVFGVLHFQNYYSGFLFYDFYCFNNIIEYDLDDYYMFRSNWELGVDYSKYTSIFPHAEENASFMRNAVYDYSDELWEQLNNGPVASSELNLDDSSVVMGGNGANDLTKPSVIQFSKKSNTNQDTNPKEKTIVDVITNPKTWNNGVMILFVSMIVIVGSSIVFIRKKNNN